MSNRRSFGISRSGSDQEFAYWISVPPVGCMAPFERARRIAQMRRRLGKWEVIVTFEGQRVQ